MTQQIVIILHNLQEVQIYLDIFWQILIACMAIIATWICTIQSNWWAHKVKPTIKNCEYSTHNGLLLIWQMTYISKDEWFGPINKHCVFSQDKIQLQNSFYLPGNVTVLYFEEHEIILLLSKCSVLTKLCKLHIMITAFTIIWKYVMHKFVWFNFLDLWPGH